MDLLNTINKKRNTEVSVNGNVYKIDGQGVCRDVAPADAQKLLSNVRGTWVIFDPEDGIKVKRKKEPVKDKVSAEVVEAPKEAWTLAEDPAEWPEVTEDLPMDMLQAMCSAYEVEFTARTTAKTLVKRLNEVMFGE